MEQQQHKEKLYRRAAAGAGVGGAREATGEGREG